MKYSIFCLWWWQNFENGFYLLVVNLNSVVTISLHYSKENLNGMKSLPPVHLKHIVFIPVTYGKSFFFREKHIRYSGWVGLLLFRSVQRALVFPQDYTFLSDFCCPLLLHSKNHLSYSLFSTSARKKILLSSWWSLRKILMKEFIGRKGWKLIAPHSCPLILRKNLGQCRGISFGHNRIYPKANCIKQTEKKNVAVILNE